MIVVMPAGHIPRSAGSPVGREATDAFVNDFVKDVMPYVETHYRVLKGRANTAIAGLSMGGGQTLQVAIPRLERFAYIGVYSSGLIGAFPELAGQRRPRRAPAAPAAPRARTPPAAAAPPPPAPRRTGGACRPRGSRCTDRGRVGEAPRREARRPGAQEGTAPPLLRDGQGGLPAVDHARDRRPAQEARVHARLRRVRPAATPGSTGATTSRVRAAAVPDRCGRPKG